MTLNPPHVERHKKKQDAIEDCNRAAAVTLDPRNKAFYGNKSLTYVDESQKNRIISVGVRCAFKVLLPLGTGLLVLFESWGIHL